LLSSAKGENFSFPVTDWSTGPTDTILLLWSMFKESFALDQRPDFPKMASSSAIMLEIYLEKCSAVFFRNAR